jgi:hypothetical protein
MLTNDIETLVNAMLRDIDGVTDPLQDYNAIELAVMRLSIDKPHLRVEDVTVASSRLADLPSRWVNDFSELQRIEYPINETPRAFIDRAELYTSPDGEKVDLGCVVAGDVRMTYTAPYLLDVMDEALTTVPEKFKEPLASYVVHLLLNQLAANYSHASDGIIQADSVDHGDKSRKFLSLAKTHLKKYEDQVGIEKPKEQGAADVINWDRPRLGLPYSRRQ